MYLSHVGKTNSAKIVPIPAIKWIVRTQRFPRIQSTTLLMLFTVYTFRPILSRYLKAGHELW